MQTYFCPTTRDAATRANLELTRTLSGERKGSLLDAIDRTVSAGGARLLAEHLAGPLTDLTKIGRRHDAVAFLAQDGALRAHLREIGARGIETRSDLILIEPCDDLARAHFGIEVGENFDHLS